MSLDKLVSLILVCFSFLMITHLYQFEQKNLKQEELEIKYFIGSVSKKENNEKLVMNEPFQYSRKVFNQDRRSIQ